MTNVPLGPGGWNYQLGHRVCVNGLGGKATKTTLQSLFGEFGHIIKIETPRSGTAAYISYQERRDAEEAIKYRDGEVVEGQRITVTKAGDRPPPSMAPKNRETTEQKEILTTTNFEREEKRTAAYMDSNGVDKRLAAESATTTRSGRSRDKDRDKDRDRARAHDRDRDRHRVGSRDRDRHRTREKDRDRGRGSRSRGRGSGKRTRHESYSRSRDRGRRRR